MPTHETHGIVIRIFQLFLLVVMASQPLAVIINYLNFLYQVETNEPINYSYLFLADKLVVLISVVLLNTVIKKIKRMQIALIINVAIGVILLEISCLSRPKFMGYIIFLIILQLNKSLALISDIKFSFFGVINVTTAAYLTTRTIIFKLQDATFPLFYSLNLLINYIITEIPIHLLFHNYDKFMINKNNIINDFKAIVNLIPNPIIIYDMELHSIILSNQAAQLKFTDSILQEVITMALHNPIPSKEIKLTDNKLTFTITTCLFETTSLANKSIIITAMDVTEISNQERKAANDDAMWLFINAASHQIRTPLSGIESSLALLQEAFNNNDKNAIKSNIEVALLSVLGLRHLIDDTLLFCNDKESKIVFSSEAFKMSEIISFLRQVFTFETFSKNIALNIQEHDNPSLVGDKKRIIHIVYTLMSNAFKYTLKGEINFKYQISNNVLLMQISDTGIGIDRDKLNSIFNVFSDADFKKSEVLTSTGISLHIAKRLILLMGGEINIESAKEIGSTFYISLPIIISRSEHYTQSIAPDLVQSQVHSIIGSSIILVVDDNTTNLFALSSMLSKMSVTFDVAHNGVEAVAKFKEGNYAVVLMDINMPIMNGFEASKVIKELKKHKKWKASVVAVSAQDAPTNDIILKECDILRWMIKPITMKALHTLLQEIGLIVEIK